MNSTKLFFLFFLFFTIFCQETNVNIKKMALRSLPFLQTCAIDSIIDSSLINKEMIDLKDADDVVKSLKTQIWGDNEKPYKTRLLDKGIVLDYPLKEIVSKDVRHVKEYEIITRFGNQTNEKLISKLYHYFPSNPNNDLFIYHSGHGYGFEWEEKNVNEKSFISKLINEGFSVLVLDMPLQSNHDSNNFNRPSGGAYSHATEAHWELYNDFNHSYLQVFFDPLWISLNYIENFNFEMIYMAGLSGGGWTTTIYSALDKRIKFSYPIAGSIPLSYRCSWGDVGDIEQFDNRLYSIASYEDFYFLASIKNRRHIQILNLIDDCCFSAINYKYWDWSDPIINKLIKISDLSYYNLYIDVTGFTHNVRENTMNFIINDIKANREIYLD